MDKPDQVKAISHKLPGWLAVAIPILLSLTYLSLQAIDFVGVTDLTPLTSSSDASVDNRSVNDPGSASALSAGERIASRSVFGMPASTPEAPPIEELPETSLQLTLRGVVVNTEATQSSAMIEGPDRKLGNYYPDDTLPGDAILRSVYHDRIVLERRNELETLAFASDNISVPLRADTRASMPAQSQPLDSVSRAPGRRLTTESNADINERLRSLRQRTQIEQ